MINFKIDSVKHKNLSGTLDLYKLRTVLFLEQGLFFDCVYK